VSREFAQAGAELREHCLNLSTYPQIQEIPFHISVLDVEKFPGRKEREKGMR
jgi:hypothetical protein